MYKRPPTVPRVKTSLSPQKAVAAALPSVELSDPEDIKIDGLPDGEYPVSYLCPSHSGKGLEITTGSSYLVTHPYSAMNLVPRGELVWVHSQPPFNYLGTRGGQLLVLKQGRLVHQGEAEARRVRVHPLGWTQTDSKNFYQDGRHIYFSDSQYSLKQMEMYPPFSETTVSGAIGFEVEDFVVDNSKIFILSTKGVIKDLSTEKHACLTIDLDIAAPLYLTQCGKSLVATSFCPSKHILTLAPINTQPLRLMSSVWVQSPLVQSPPSAPVYLPTSNLLVSLFSDTSQMHISSFQNNKLASVGWIKMTRPILNLRWAGLHSANTLILSGDDCRLTRVKITSSN